MEHKITNVGLGAKLAGAALTFVVPIGIMAVLIFQGYARDIQFSEKEIAGNQMIAPLVRIAAALPMVYADTETADAASQRVVAAADQLAARHREVGAALQFTSDGLSIRGRDRLMPPAVAARLIDLTQSTGVARQQAVPPAFSDVREMIVHAGDTSNLILDPDLDSYYLMDVTLLAVPELIAKINEIISPDSITETEAAIYRADISDAMDRIRESINTAVNEDPNFYGSAPGLAASLESALQRFASATAPLDRHLQGIARGGDPARSARVAAAEPILAETVRFWDAVAAEQNALLRVRIATYRRQLFIAIGLSAAAVAFAAGVVTLLGRSAVRQARSTEGALVQAANRDLTTEVSARTRDELGRAARAAGSLISSLHGFVGWLRTQASDTRGYAEQLSGDGTTLDESSASIAGGIEQLSAAIEELSRTLEQIEANARRQQSLAKTSADEMEQLAVGFRSTAETTGEMAQNADSNARVSEESAAVVNAAIDEVRAIAGDLSSIGQHVRSAGEATTGVDSIVATVRDISDRTALLAMNAAIEAAHAGDRGRGFAVVASEIRSLSSRTAEALQQIEAQLGNVRTTIADAVTTAEAAEGRIDKIGESTARAKESLETVRENAIAVGQMINTIQSSAEAQTEPMRRVSDAIAGVGEMSSSVLAALAEQTTGAAEMVDSVRQIQEATTQNSTIASRVSQLSQTLTEQSRAIDDQISSYRL